MPDDFSLMAAAGWTLLAYLFGAISFAWLVCRLVAKSDLKSVGSGNLGATNVSRACGRGWALLVYALDLSKGLLPVLLARHVLGDPVLFHGAAHLALIMGGAAFLGHCFPVQFGFKGGKGVATASGVVLALTPPVLLYGFGAFFLGALLTRRVSVGSLLAALALPASLYVTRGREAVFDDAVLRATFGLYAGMCLVVFVLHRTNIARLFKGTEPRIGGEKK